ncbi:hypothetical protein MJG53_015695 [Ovis ammon polii x Ovis aries]|uniref:Uncharacterized protein n=1 Tax=Ovis ammon polii x Ovis aries TaxID=2918886 RepID=A0ACB9UFW9_9CETA|nr:hypothetical protein MJG53_015695 [Ovis ammon polii x Ovis aries]
MAFGVQKLGTGWVRNECPEFELENAEVKYEGRRTEELRVHLLSACVTNAQQRGKGPRSVSTRGISAGPWMPGSIRSHPRRLLLRSACIRRWTSHAILRPLNFTRVSISIWVCDVFMVYPSAQQQTHCHPYCITLSNQQRRCSRPPRVRKFAARWRRRALGAELRESSARRTLSQDLLAPPGKILSFTEASMPQLAFTTSLDIYHNVICKMHSGTEEELTHSAEWKPAVHTGVEERITKSSWGFPVGSMDRNLPENAGDTGSIPDLEPSHLPRSKRLEPVLHNKRSHRNEKPPSPRLEKALVLQ